MDGFPIPSHTLPAFMKCDMDMFLIKCESGYCGRCKKEKSICIAVHYSFYPEDPGVDFLCLDCASYIHYRNRNIYPFHSTK